MQVRPVGTRDCLTGKRLRPTYTLAGIGVEDLRAEVNTPQRGSDGQQAVASA